MSTEIECMDPKRAKHIVGGLLGGGSVFQIQGTGCAEVKRWLEEQAFSMDWVALVENSQLEAIYVMFPAKEQSDPEVRAVNDAYMLFKMSWKGREGIDWNDQHYTKCTLRTWINSMAAP